MHDWLSSYHLTYLQCMKYIKNNIALPCPTHFNDLTKVV